MRVLITPDELYFGFDCSDTEPSRIAIHTMQRDGDVEGDDTVAVILDTYGDRRTGYFFQINAAGARVDGLVADPEDPSLDWDGIWDARTSRSDRGWSAEIIIPARSLSFAGGRSSWGVNFERNIARDRTVLRWSSATLDSFFYDLSRAGTLSGVQDLRQGLGLEISPYVVGRMKDFFQEQGRTWQGSPGIDVTYRMTPQMAAVFTVEHRFCRNGSRLASVEPDAISVVLSLSAARSSLRAPISTSSALVSRSSSSPSFRAAWVCSKARRFRSIQASSSTAGRRWNIGLLDVQTRDAILQGSTTLVPGTNLFAGRVSYDVNPRLRLGTILTNGSPDGIRRNRFAGFDGVWRTSEFLGDKNFLVGAWSALSAGDVAEGNRSGWGFKIDYPNDLWDCFTSLNQFGEALDPALGFLPRPGTRRFDADCEFKPRPRKDGPFGWIRQHFMEHRFYQVVNHRGSWSRRVSPGRRSMSSWSPAIPSS